VSGAPECGLGKPAKERASCGGLRVPQARHAVYAGPEFQEHLN
jgi:hypothetical protein